MKLLFKLSFIIACIFFISCNNKETPQSVADRWCELNGKVYRAKTESEKESARRDREDYEKKMEEKYKNDKAMMDKIGKAVEACEAESER